MDLWVGAGDKIWVRGPNGAGKSTLVRALLEAATLRDDEVLVLPQEVDEREVRERLLALPPARRGEVLTAVAALGVEPAGLLGSASLSPGEARKLRIAVGLGSGVALLVLDEPSNHMDLASVERLQRALAAYPGAILLVTHDPDLGASVARIEWRLQDGRVAVAHRG